MHGPAYGGLTCCPPLSRLSLLLFLQLDFLPRLPCPHSIEPELLMLHWRPLTLWPQFNLISLSSHYCPPLTQCSSQSPFQKTNTKRMTSSVNVWIWEAKWIEESQSTPAAEAKGSTWSLPVIRDSSYTRKLNWKKSTLPLKCDKKYDIS